MRLSKLLSLPPAILILIASHTNPTIATESDQSPTQWPYNLPPHVKYWPEDPPNRRRDLEVLEENLRLGRSPGVVKKMGADEGEKFYMEYWQFEETLEQAVFWDVAKRTLPQREVENDREVSANYSMAYRAPFALHGEADARPPNYLDIKARKTLEERGNAADVLARLQGRQFSCPGGTSNCASIGYPNSCCGTDQTCFVIQDTGLGSVGCCPKGSSCGGVITNCDAPNTPCPDNLGGGCCIPNYVCSGIGCVLMSSLAVTVVTTVTLMQSTAFSLSVQTTTSTAVVVVAPPPSTTNTYTGLQTTLPCSSNFHACPVAVGGGCCLSGRTCALYSCGLPPGSSETIFNTNPISFSGATTTGTGVAPARPTAQTTSSSLVVVGTTCPTGFYACEAYYAGGCCRTGRDCATTSCPVTSSTTIISSGQTVVVPVGPAATVNSPTGSCATGWTSCAPSVGGNCCPSGWECGTASCTSVSATRTAEAQKAAPNSALGNRRGSVGGVMVGLGVALLFMWH